MVAIEVELLLGICEFNGSSLKLCSIVNFILECKFLCNLLKFSNGHFLNIK